MHIFNYNLSDGMVDITNLKFVGVSRKRSSRFLDKYSRINQYNKL
jgi:hypothetical protein